MSKRKVDNAPEHETAAQDYGEQESMRGKKMSHRRSKRGGKRKGRRKGGR